MPLDSAPAASVVVPAERTHRRVDVLRLLPYTALVHALLPVLIWALAGGGYHMTVQGLLWVVHLGFPVVLVASYPYWEGQGTEMVALVGLNHLVMFGVGFGLFLAVA